MRTIKARFIYAAVITALFAQALLGAIGKAGLGFYDGDH